MHKGKRFLSLLWALVLALSSVPMPALGVETSETLPAALLEQALQAGEETTAPTEETTAPTEETTAPTEETTAPTEETTAPTEETTAPTEETTAPTEETTAPTEETTAPTEETTAPTEEKKDNVLILEEAETSDEAANAGAAIPVDFLALLGEWDAPPVNVVFQSAGDIDLHAYLVNAYGLDVPFTCEPAAVAFGQYADGERFDITLIAGEGYEGSCTVAAEVAYLNTNYYYSNYFDVEAKVTEWIQEENVYGSHTFPRYQEPGEEAVSSYTSTGKGTIKSASIQANATEYGYYLYLTPEASTAYTLKIENVTAPDGLEFIGGWSDQTKRYNATFDAETYGAYKIRFELSAVHNTMDGLQYDNRPFELTVVFRGYHEKEAEITENYGTGNQTFTAKVNGNAGNYNFSWKKKGENTVLGTGQTLTVTNAAVGDEYICTISRKVTTDTDGCLGSQGSWTYTAKVADEVVYSIKGKTLTYTGGEQLLVDASVTGGTVKYLYYDGSLYTGDFGDYIEGYLVQYYGTWETIPPKMTAPGSYRVYYRVYPDDDHIGGVTSGFDNYVTTVIKNPATFTTEPAAIERRYDGNPQVLVSAGTTSCGTVQYRLSQNESWSDELPKATDADAYTVYYRIKGTGNYSDSEEKSLTATIQQAGNIATPPQAISGLKYDGTNQTLIQGGSATFGKMEYSLDNVNWSETPPQGKNATSYTVQWRVQETKNWTGVFSSVTASIAKAVPVVQAPVGENLKFTGTSQQLIQAGGTDYGTMEYSADGGSTWTEAIPEKTNAGTYPVKWRVQASDNWEGKSGEVTATITAVDTSELTVALVDTDKTYHGKEQTQAVTVKLNDVDVSNWITVTGDKETDAGDYVLSIAGDGNSITGTAVTRDWRIAALPVTITVEDLHLTANGISQSNENRSIHAEVSFGTLCTGIYQLGVGSNTIQPDMTELDAVEFSLKKVSLINVSEDPQNMCGEVTENTNYQFNVTGGMMKILPIDKTITVTSGGDSKEYDGTALTDSDYIIEGNGDLTAEVTLAASEITEIGSVNNQISQVVFKDNGNVVYDSSVEATKQNINSVTITEGILEVERNTTEVDIISGSASKEYDGTELTAPVTINGNKSTTATVNGFTVEVTRGIHTIMDVGTQTNEITKVVIKNGDILIYDSLEKNDTFTSVTTTQGELKIEANSSAFEICSDSETWEYDGQVHTKPSAQVDVQGSFAVTDETGGRGSLVYPMTNGHTLTITLKGNSLQDVSVTENEIDSVVITNKDGKDVTKYFPNIETKNGQMQVVPNASTITVLAKSGVRYYDATPLELPTPDLVLEKTTRTEADGTVLAPALTVTDMVKKGNITEYTLNTGDVLRITTKGSITAPGETENKIVDCILLRDGRDMMANYTGLYSVDGKLKVEANPSVITILPGGVARHYTGEPLSCDTVTVTVVNALTPDGYLPAKELKIVDSKYEKGQNIFTLSTGEVLTAVVDKECVITDVQRDAKGNVVDVPTTASYTMSGLPEGMSIADCYSGVQREEGSLTLWPFPVKITVNEAKKYYTEDYTKLTTAKQSPVAVNASAEEWNRYITVTLTDMNGTVMNWMPGDETLYYTVNRKTAYDNPIAKVEGVGTYEILDLTVLEKDGFKLSNYEITMDLDADYIIRALPDYTNPKTGGQILGPVLLMLASSVGMAMAFVLLGKKKGKYQR